LAALARFFDGDATCGRFIPSGELLGIMGLFNRTFRVIRAKLNALVSLQEDPMEQLELAYEDLRDERRDMKASIVDVKTQRKKLERKIERFDEDIEENNHKARQAMEQGEEDLAQHAIEQKKSKEQAVENLQSQVEDIEQIEDDLRDKLDQLDNRVDELETKKEILKAKYEGAEAINDVNAVVSDGMGEYSLDENIGDVKREIEAMQSRAAAVQEFEQEQDDQDIDARLDEITMDSDVESEMQTLRESVDVGVDVARSDAECELA